MRLRKIRNVLAAVCLIVSFWGLSIKVSAQEYDRFIEVKNFVEDYFKIVDKSYAELSMDTELVDFFESENSLDYQVIDTIIEHRKTQISDLCFSNYDSQLLFEDISADNNVFNVIVNKETEMYFNCLHGEPSSVYEQHKLVIKQQNDGTFKIVSDEYGDDIRDLLKTYSGESTNVFSAKSKLLQETKNSVDIQREQLKALKLEKLSIADNTMPENGDIALAAFGFTAYNRSAARDYAYTYVLSPNPSYANYESMGGNCTNFTSQCLKAGGIKQDYTGNYQWYYNSSSDRAPAWTSANYFRSYYKNNVGSSSIKGLRAYTSNFSSMRLGDLVQLVSSGSATHTMFISSPIYDNWASDDPWQYKYDVGICQNSTSAASRQRNVPLSTKPSNREYIHIEGSYN